MFSLVVENKNTTTIELLLKPKSFHQAPFLGENKEEILILISIKDREETMICRHKFSYH